MSSPCPHCGFENTFEAVFCRQCGQKLEIDTMRPDFTTMEPDAWVKVKLYAPRIAQLLAAMLVVFICVGLFMKGEINEPELSIKQTKSAEKKADLLEKVLDPTGLRMQEMKLTMDEANYLLNERICRNKSLKGRPAAIALSANDNGLITLRIHYMLGKIGTEYTWIGKVYEDDEGNLKFRCHGVDIGWIPIWFFGDSACENIEEALFTHPKAKFFMEYVKAIDVDSENVKLRFKTKR